MPSEPAQSRMPRPRSVAAAGTEIVGLTPFFGAESVEGNFESYLAAIAVMDMAAIIIRE